MGWSNPDPRKATPRYLCIRPTTPPLYQGAGKVGTMRPEDLLASGRHKSLLGMQGRRFDPGEDSLLFTSSIPR